MISTNRDGVWTTFLPIARLGFVAGISFIAQLLLFAPALLMLQFFDRVLTSQSHETRLLLLLGMAVALSMMLALGYLRNVASIRNFFSVEGLLAALTRQSVQSLMLVLESRVGVVCARSCRISLDGGIHDRFAYIRRPHPAITFTGPMVRLNLGSLPPQTSEADNAQLLPTVTLVMPIDDSRLR